jgi:hypothetical protein
MKSFVVSMLFVFALHFAAPPVSHAGSPGPAPREVLLHTCPSDAGACTTSNNEASCSDPSGPCTCATSGAPCPPINVVAGPVTADLVLTATDNPTCDSDATLVCGTDIPGCTNSAGSLSTLDILVRGRFRKNDGSKDKGGKPFSVEQSFSSCVLGVHSCSSGDPALLCSNNGARLTESLLLETFARDIAWQPLPSSLATALANALKAAGTPYVSNVLARTVDHDGTADASATVVRFSVQIEFIQ